MKAINSPRVFLLWLVLTLPAGGFAEIKDPAFELDPVFGSNMVLQKSPNTRLAGKATANQPIWVEFTAKKYRVGPSNALVTASGDWEIWLNLDKVAAATPGVLSVWEGEKRAGRRRGSLALTNVAVGTVWLLAEPENQGLPASPNETAETPNRDKVRFLDFSRIQRRRDADPRRDSAWEVFPAPADVGRFSALAIRLGHYFAISRSRAEYVGIVQVTSKDVEAGLLPNASEMPATAEFRDKIWGWVNQSVRAEQDRRWKLLVDAKRRGEVTEIPPVYEYAPPSVYAYGAFSGSNPLTSRLTFGAAIWPRQPKQ